MPRHTFFAQLALTALVTAFAAGSVAAQQPGGLIRIGDANANTATGGTIRLTDHSGCADDGCEDGDGGLFGRRRGGGVGGWLSTARSDWEYRRKNPMYFDDHLKRLFCPWCTQEGTAGREPLPGMGHFEYDYPTNPNYFDPRDGRVYSAQGFGVPLAMPLSPKVHHTYNYSHGTPGSRITPISRMPGQR